MSISAAKVMELRNATSAGMMDCKRALEAVDGDLEQAKDFLRKKGITVAAKKSSRETTEGGIGIAFSDDRKSAAIVQLACETDFVARNENFKALLDTMTGQVLAMGDDDVPAQRLAGGEGTVGDLITQAIGKMGENLQLLEAQRLQAQGDGLIGGYVHSNNKIGVLVVLQGAAAGGAEGAEALAKDISMHVAASQVHSVTAEGIDPAVLEKEREILTAQAKESGKPDDIAAKMVEGRIRKFIKEVALLDQPFVKDPEKTVAQVVQEAGAAMGAELTVERFLKLQF